MENSILSVDSLSLAFKSGKQQEQVVHNISFALQKGEILGILGESGSGKSVTSYSLLSLLGSSAVFTNGSITYNGKDQPLHFANLNQTEFAQLRGKEIAIIFQEPMTALNPAYTCGNQLIEAVNADKVTAKEQVLQSLTDVKLQDVERIFKSYPHELSGGQKQRVMIAMALLQNPKVLIADEPTTALDAHVKRSILELIKDLAKQRNLAVLFISHDMDAIAHIADRVLVMYKGKIVEQGATAVILQNPQEDYTKALMACKPSLKKDIAWLPTLEIPNPNFQVPKESGGNEIVLAIKNLSVEFTSKPSFFKKGKATVKAVNNVSFILHQGQSLGLIGESGSGKSTIGNAIMRFVPAKSGEIIYENRNITALTKAQLKDYRKDVQLIYQDPYSSLNPSQSIGSSLMEVMQIHGVGGSKAKRKELAGNWLETVELSRDHLNRYPHEFSGGQRQRIAIARALCLEPKIIICDEAVSALDVSVQAGVLNLLKKLKLDLGLSYLFITHDLAVARFICDDILVLQNGTLQEAGPAKQVIEQPESAYTRHLIEESMFK